MKLHYLRDMGLDKKDAFLRVKPSRQPVEHHLIYIFLQATGIFQCGQSMDINDAIDAIILILKADPILQRSQVVPQVLPAGGTSPRKNATLHLSLLKGKV
jgi:hypothetical protein